MDDTQIYDDDGPMLRVIVGGREVFGCTLRDVAPDGREWLAGHIATAFKREIARAFNEGRWDAQEEIRRALGIE
jgi:hypothetical protein